MKITKNTIKRAIRTFIQAFCGALLTAGAAIDWYNVDLKGAGLGVLITSLFAGLSALAMNMEEKNGINKNNKRKKRS